MSQLKKKSKVVLLPIKKSSNLLDRIDNFIVSLPEDNYKYLHYINKTWTKEYINLRKAKAYHLYILSDDLPEINCYTVWENLFIEHVIKVGNGFFVTTGGVRNPQLGTSKKIIACTDSLLGLEEVGKAGYSVDDYDKIASPSEAFINEYIESYNKGQVIEECMVEYDTMYNTSKGLKPYPDEKESLGWITAPRVRKDNTIIITKIQTEWNKDELFTIVRDIAFKIAREELLIVNEQDVKDYLNSVL